MAGNTFFFGWEIGLIEWLQTVFSGLWTKLAVVLTYLGDEKFVVIIVMLLYWCLNKDLGRRVAVNLLTGVTVNPLIKNIFLRRRPYFDNKNIKCLKPAKSDADIYDASAQGFSFPSGHAMNTATIFGTLAKHFKKSAVTIAAIVIIFLVGISRVILGVHYPTDILVGWAVGTGVVFLMSWLQDIVKKRYILYLAVLLVCSVGFFYCKSHDFFSAYGLLIGFFAGDLFEARYVNFKNTKKWWRIVLRMVVGLGIFLGLSTLLKKVLPDMLISNMIRYAVSTFIAIGLFPMSFRLLDKKEVVQID